MEDTPRLEKHIAALKSQMKVYSREKTTVPELMSSKNFYIGVWVGTLALLLIGRPNFLYAEDSAGKRHFSFSKLIMAWLLIGFTLTLGIFGFNYAGKK